YCAPHSSNRPDPTQAEQRRTPAHSSVRGKTNAQVTGGAADSTRKAVGHFEDKHRRISRRNRLPAQAYPGPRLFIFSTQGKAAHGRKRDRLPAVARVAAEERSGGRNITNQLVR